MKETVLLPCVVCWCFCHTLYYLLSTSMRVVCQYCGYKTC